MNAVKIIKARKDPFFFHALVKIDAIRFILLNVARRLRGEEDGGLRDTGYGTDHACEGCFHPPRTRPWVQKGEESTHSVHLRCILRKSRTCQAIRISFFIPRTPGSLLRALSTCNPLLIPFPPFSSSSSSSFPLARFSFVLRLVSEAPPSTFLSTRFYPLVLLIVSQQCGLGG